MALVPSKVDIFGNKNINGAWGKPMAWQSTSKKPEAQSRSENKLAYKSRGVATTFSYDKYDVSHTTYPNDLMSDTNQYGGNYVIFYINVAEDSKLLNQLKSDYETVADTSAIPPRQRGDALALNTSKTQAVAVGTLGGAAAGKLGRIAGLGSSSTLKKGASLGLAASLATASTAASFSRAQKRLKKAIALYMPNELSVRYSMDWSEEDTALASALFAGADFIAGFLPGGKKSGIGQASADALKTMGTYGTLKAPVLGDYTSAQTGLATNPKKEQIFKGVNYRTFTMNYSFHPRSKAEVDNVNEIIHTFKLHMHPEFKDSYNFLYIYPSEFDIYYYQNGKENMNLHRHTSVVLTDMDVNYTPNGIYSSFEDGMPTQINITLQFKELALLTKDNILDGF